jgi:hypothetical protein
MKLTQNLNGLNLNEIGTGANYTGSWVKGKSQADKKN